MAIRNPMRVLGWILALFTVAAVMAALSAEPKSSRVASQSNTTLSSVTTGGVSGDRIFALTSDVTSLGSIDEEVRYDAAITSANLYTEFQANAQPYVKALIVSKEFLASAIPPSSQNPTGNPAYLNLYHVLSTGHILFVFDRSSADIFAQLGMADMPAPFDPNGSIVPSQDKDADALHAGTAVSYEFGNVAQGEGWTVLDVQTDRGGAAPTNTPGPSPTPTAGPTPHDLMRWSGKAVLPSRPPYFAVYDRLREYVEERENAESLSSSSNEGGSNQPCMKRGDVKQVLHHVKDYEYYRELKLTFWESNPFNNKRLCCPYGYFKKSTWIWTPLETFCPPFSPSATYLAEHEQPWIVCEEFLTYGSDKEHPITSRIAPVSTIMPGDPPPTPNPSAPKVALPCVRYVDPGGLNLPEVWFPVPGSSGIYNCSIAEPEDWFTFYSIKGRHQADPSLTPVPRLHSWSPNSDIDPDTGSRTVYGEVNISWPPGIIIGASSTYLLASQIALDQDRSGGGALGPDAVSWKYFEEALIDQADPHGGTFPFTLPRLTPTAAPPPTPAPTQMPPQWPRPYTSSDICLAGWLKHNDSLNPVLGYANTWHKQPLLQSAMQFDESNVFRHDAIWLTDPKSSGMTHGVPYEEHQLSLDARYDVAYVSRWEGFKCTYTRIGIGILPPDCSLPEDMDYSSCLSKYYDYNRKIRDVVKYCPGTPIPGPPTPSPQ